MASSSSIAPLRKDFPVGAAVSGANRYGKESVRVAKVKRGPVQEITDLDVRVLLEGDFANHYEQGSNATCLPTDTVKNKIFVLASEHPCNPIEDFAIYIANSFLREQPQVTGIYVDITQLNWSRIDGHAHSFIRDDSASDHVSYYANRSGSSELVSSLDGMRVLKTTQSGFTGYIKEKHTLLKETTDRIFATSVAAEWRFTGGAANAISSKVDFAKARAQVKASIKSEFAGPNPSGVYSPSAQYTLFKMGEKALALAPELDNIKITTPNLHYIPYNFEPFGMKNKNEVLIPAYDPHGFISSVIQRNGKSTQLPSRL